MGVEWDTYSDGCLQFDGVETQGYIGFCVCEHLRVGMVGLFMKI